LFASVIVFIIITIYFIFIMIGNIAMIINFAVICYCIWFLFLLLMLLCYIFWLQ